MSRINKLRRLAAIGLCVAIMALCLPMQAGRAENEDILRLHVLANSDSSTDQAIKLRVRDAVLSWLQAYDSADETEAHLLLNGKELLSLVETALREAGADYGAQLMLGRTDFPARSYDGRTFPAGSYRALRIVLGGGAGQNWWCVLFPPLCIISNDAQNDTGEIRFESTILNWLRGKGEK